MKITAGQGRLEDYCRPGQIEDYCRPGQIELKMLQSDYCNNSEADLDKAIEAA